MNGDLFVNANSLELLRGCTIITSGNIMIGMVSDPPLFK